MAVVLIGSTGKLPDSWSGVVAHLTERPYIPFLEGKTLAARTRELETYLDKHELRRPTLVGHGIGALSAMQVAAARPIERLVLSNPVLSHDKDAVEKQRKGLRWVPNFMLKSVGTDKQELNAALEELGQLDLNKEALLIQAPTRVLGAGEGAAAAREVAEAISGADFREVKASGDWYTSQPDLFAAEAGLI